MSDPSLSEDEAAEYLGLQPQTLRVMRMNTKGPAYFKMGRRVLYDKSDLNAYRQSCRVDPLAQATAPKPAPRREIEIHDLQGRSFAIRVARSFITTGKPPTDEPHWRNMRLSAGNAPADVRKAFHLPETATFGDVFAAITRDKSEPAGRHMIEVDKAGAKGKPRVESIWERQEREHEERQKEDRANRLADNKAKAKERAS